MPVAQRKGVRLAAVLAVLMLMSVSTAMQASASNEAKGWAISKLGSNLPYAVYRSAAVWNGEKAYLISGRTDKEQVDTIIEFNPSTGKSTVKNARIPMARIMAGAAWFGGNAYVFGGQNLSTILNDVVMYNPDSDIVTVLPYKMPYTRVGMTAVTVGDSILLMGGRNETDYFSTVLRFYPTNGTFVPMPPTPIKGGGRTGVFTGDRVYLFGSCINAKGYDVLEVDGHGGTSEIVDVGPPRGFYWSSSVWTNGTALIFGGTNYNTTIDPVLEFTSTGAAKGEMKQVGKLPKPLENSAAFYDTRTHKAYLLGGRSTTKGSANVYVIHRENLSDVSFERAIFVAGLMAFVVIVVAVQSVSKKTAEARKEEQTGPKKVTSDKVHKLPDMPVRSRR